MWLHYLIDSDGFSLLPDDGFIVTFGGTSNRSEGLLQKFQDLVDLDRLSLNENSGSSEVSNRSLSESLNDWMTFIHLQFVFLERRKSSEVRHREFDVLLEVTVSNDAQSGILLSSEEYNPLDEGCFFKRIKGEYLCLFETEHVTLAISTLLEFLQILEVFILEEVSTRQGPLILGSVEIERGNSDICHCVYSAGPENSANTGICRIVLPYQASLLLGGYYTSPLCSYNTNVIRHAKRQIISRLPVKRQTLCWDYFEPYRELNPVSSSQEDSANLLRLDGLTIAVKPLLEAKIPDDLGNDDPVTANAARIESLNNLEIRIRMFRHVEKILVGDERVFTIAQANNEGAAACALNFERKVKGFIHCHN